MFMFFNVSGRVVATVVVIAYSSAWFLVFLPPVFYVYQRVQKFYVPSSRQLQRIVSTRQCAGQRPGSLRCFEMELRKATVVIER